MERRIIGSDDDGRTLSRGLGGGRLGTIVMTVHRYIHGTNNLTALVRGGQRHTPNASYPRTRVNTEKRTIPSIISFLDKISNFWVLYYIDLLCHNLIIENRIVNNKARGIRPTRQQYVLSAVPIGLRSEVRTPKVDDHNMKTDYPGINIFPNQVGLGIARIAASISIIITRGSDRVKGEAHKIVVLVREI
jgi:hypothetical protein